jgi:hypothetical protein
VQYNHNILSNSETGGGSRLMLSVADTGSGEARPEYVEYMYAAPSWSSGAGRTSYALTRKRE